MSVVRVVGARSRGARYRARAEPTTIRSFTSARAWHLAQGTETRSLDGTYTYLHHLNICVSLRINLRVRVYV